MDEDLESIIAGRMEEISETLKSHPHTEREYQIYFNACSINLAYLTRSACLMQESACLMEESAESRKLSRLYERYAKKYEAQGERLYQEMKRLLEDKE